MARFLLELAFMRMCCLLADAVHSRRRALSRQLDTYGWRVEHAHTPLQAINSLVRIDHLDVAIAAPSLGRIPAAAMLEFVFHNRPRLLRVLLDDRHETDPDPRAIELAHAFLPVPWTVTDLETLQMQVAGPPGRHELGLSLHPPSAI